MRVLAEHVFLEADQVDPPFHLREHRVAVADTVGLEQIGGELADPAYRLDRDQVSSGLTGRTPAAVTPTGGRGGYRGSPARRRPERARQPEPGWCFPGPSARGEPPESSAAGRRRSARAAFARPRHR